MIAINENDAVQQSQMASKKRTATVFTVFNPKCVHCVGIPGIRTRLSVISWNALNDNVKWTQNCVSSFVESGFERCAQRNVSITMFGVMNKMNN